MNFNELWYMLCVSDCIIVSVGFIKLKDCLCIVVIMVLMWFIFFLKCVYGFKNVVFYDIIFKFILFD